MQTNLTWEKGIFSNQYNIYKNGILIGILKDQTFSRMANGEINGKSYLFRTKGFFKQDTEIIDNNENMVIGSITYNNMMNKATISFHDKTVGWKYDNIWNTRWSIFDSEGNAINYASSTTRGMINSNIDDELLLLCGLFVTNYYTQLTVAVIVAVFIPIFVSTLN